MPLVARHMGQEEWEHTSQEEKHKPARRVEMDLVLVSVGQCRDMPAQSWNFSENIVNIGFHRHVIVELSRWYTRNNLHDTLPSTTSHCKAICQVIYKA
jgi:hypothetical protein